MNVYDFDNTIFRGDSSARFWFYCLRTRPRTAAALPRIALHGVLFRLGKESKTDFKQRFFSFLAYLEDREDAVNEFWEKNIGRIKPWYNERKRADDVIISASPDFLVRPICEKLGVALIASEVDPDSGEFYRPNCSDGEKPIRFRELYGDAQPDEFYSDSLSDTPMAEMSKKSILVKGNRLKPWPKK